MRADFLIARRGQVLLAQRGHYVRALFKTIFSSSVTSRFDYAVWQVFVSSLASMWTELKKYAQ